MKPSSNPPLQPPLKSPAAERQAPLGLNEMKADIPKTLEELLRIVERLRLAFPKKRFTLDKKRYRTPSER